MSSCFLCDTSYDFVNRDRYSAHVDESINNYYFYMKQVPIMVGSSGTGTNDQQHTNDKTQNYVSYRVKKIEFRSSVRRGSEEDRRIPDYIIIFKVPFRNPVIDYNFFYMSNFILYSEPESVLGYCLCPVNYIFNVGGQRNSSDFNITITKPFIVGPNDYVGVLYFFSNKCHIYSSAKVWFDIV